MYIGLISDTHGVFSDGFKKFLEPVDVIWHAGDFGGGISFADSIAAFKPLVGVSGNCDGQDIRREYPQHQYLEVQGLKKDTVKEEPKASENREGDLKRLEPLTEIMDEKHTYEIIIFNAYIQNDGWWLTEDQRAAAYSEYKRTRNYI